ncbi:hypothetical protein, partial [uncultured Actinomyces sp.]|uniref:hypothetical protein n=1 Tax=uncultured Actinomyces sp. TaxID=249061 RepID=UPI0028D4C9C8
AVRGPSVPAAADPRHDVEQSRTDREGLSSEPTSLGTEWRNGDPPAGTADQATRPQPAGARDNGRVEAW